MKNIFLVLALFSLSAFAEPAPPPLYFQGAFGASSATHPACLEVFNGSEYEVKYYRMGSTARTAVVHFRSEAASAFLDRMTLVGLIGGSSDLQVEKVFTKGNRRYRLVAEGMVGWEFILLNLNVTVYEGSEKICEGLAEYTGYTR